MEALLVLLCVAHLQFEDILKKIPPKKLLIDLAILCDAYLCRDLMRHWMKTWITREWDYDVDPWVEDRHAWKKRNKIADLKTIMLLSWVFGPVSNVNLFKIGVEWLYLDNVKDKISEFSDEWPMPVDLMSMFFPFSFLWVCSLTIQYREYLRFS